jgi:hypothetical protein
VLVCESQWYLLGLMTILTGWQIVTEYDHVSTVRVQVNLRSLKSKYNRLRPEFHI